VVLRRRFGNDFSSFLFALIDVHLPPGQNHLLLTDITRRTNLKDFNLLLNNFISDESGQDLIEYALVASLVALGAVAALNTLAGSIKTVLGNIGTQLTTPPTT
jgi:pilus assembly protein Flp/PilA